MKSELPKKPLWRIALAISIAAAAQQANAQIVDYDGFNYTAGTGVLAGQNGGTGWGTAWTDKSNPTVINSTGLSYTDGGGNSLVTSGGSITDNNATPSTTFSPERLIGATTSITFSNVAAANTAASGTVWMSYLWQGNNTGGQGTGGNSYRQASLMFLKGATTASATGTEFLDLGMPNVNNLNINPNFSLWGANGFIGGTLPSTTPLESSVAANTGAPLFVLIEMNVDNTTNTDTINIWLNPLLNAANQAALGAANLTYSGQDLSSINGFRFQSSATNATYQTGGQQSADEVRIGDTLADVTPYTTVPEPASMALAALGGAGMLALIRRKK